MKDSVDSIVNFIRQNRYGKIVLVLLIVILIGVPAFLLSNQPKETYLPLSEVSAAISAGQVQKIEDSLDTGSLTIYYADGTKKSAQRDTQISFLEQMHYLGLTDGELAKIQYEIVHNSVRSGEAILSSLFGIAVFGALAFAVIRVTGRGSVSTKKNFKKSEVPPVTFEDVAGIDECRQELHDLVSFLMHGDQYKEIGAKMPRGVLLVGEPGTGKTLLAKAIAGEAGVPFFSTSGSEFVEVFVGVGASRVRALFKRAREHSPCIVFIDEIDAIGRKRHGSAMGGDMEQDQTLNQLLVEMDGFEGSEGVVVLAATNRLDVLDSALTRPGRFDRQVQVPRPDINGREAILRVHVKDKRIALDVNLRDLARSTPGLVGADLANIVNEAAILAVRSHHDQITMADLQEAVEKNLAGGAQQKSRVMSASEKRTIAYHEAGHAVVMHATPHADPVYKITIIPRGPMGGYTMALPEQDSLLVSRNQFLARIIGLMGGRVAEEMFCDDITSGASNDLKVATQLAEEMVMRLGMGVATGLRVYPRPEGYEALSAPRGAQRTFEAIDKAIDSILQESYAEARRILTEQKEALERVAQGLLEHETLTRDEFVNLI